MTTTGLCIHSSVVGLAIAGTFFCKLKAILTILACSMCLRLADCGRTRCTFRTIATQGARSNRIRTLLRKI
jgi:hypothetical protein